MFASSSSSFLYATAGWVAAILVSGTDGYVQHALCVHIAAGLEESSFLQALATHTKAIYTHHV